MTTNVSADGSHIIFDQTINNKEKSSNIKVYTRFRPFNKTENVFFFLLFYYNHLIFIYKRNLLLMG